MKKVIVLITVAAAISLVCVSCASYGAAKKSLPESALEPSKGLALMIPESPPSEKLTGKDEAEPEKTQEAQTGPTVKYLSADDSNSMASPVVVRKMVKAGRYVQPSLVRTYEFLNYYHFDYPFGLSLFFDKKIQLIIDIADKFIFIICKIPDFFEILPSLNFTVFVFCNYKRAELKIKLISEMLI